MGNQLLIGYKEVFFPKQPIPRNNYATVISGVPLITECRVVHMFTEYATKGLKLLYLAPQPRPQFIRLCVFYSLA